MVETGASVEKDFANLSGENPHTSSSSSSLLLTSDYYPNHQNHNGRILPHQTTPMQTPTTSQEDHHHHLIATTRNHLQLQQQAEASGDLYSQLMQVNAWISGPVRTMIAQNLVEISLICVIIIIYLVYYFSQISKKPKLIGNERSEFVRFISDNLSKTIRRRFNPLIYFWGTNAQTALFGYLQGQTSTNEMPRNQFKRQYLYVSDLQYLTSNVDLSQHYHSGSKLQDTEKKAKRMHLYQLQCDEIQQQQHQQKQQQHEPTSQLDRNVRLVLDELMMQQQQQQQQQEGKHQQEVVNQHQQHQLIGLKRLKELDLSSSSASSSSDSGVFPNSGCHSSSSSSTSSLADDSISLDMSASTAGAYKCRCHSANHRQSSSASSTISNYNNNNNNQQQQQAQQQQLVINSGATREAGLACDGIEPPVPEQSEFGQCALDWHKPSHRNYHQNKLVALISAGMTTGSDKKYVTDTVSTLSELGYEVCVFIRRGVGGLKLSSNKFFSPAKWRDFEAALWSVRQQRPEARLVAVGFSFGSIELCRYLTMSGKQSLVDAALLVSCPFDPEAGGRNMRRRALNRRIDAYLAHSLGKQLYQARISTIEAEMAARQQQQTATQTDNESKTTTTTVIESKSEGSLRVSNFNGSICDLSHLPKLKSLVDFEDNYNRIIQNYPNSEAYAADCRLHEHLQNIQTPTLCLSSEDDFMAPRRLLPLQQIEANEHLCMLLTKRGGHMAFIDGLVWPKKPYFAQRIIGAYMEAIKGRLPPASPSSSSPSSSSSPVYGSSQPSTQTTKSDAKSSPSPSSVASARTNSTVAMLNSESRQPSQDSTMSAKSHWHLIPMNH